MWRESANLGLPPIEVCGSTRTRGYKLGKCGLSLGVSDRQVQQSRQFTEYSNIASLRSQKTQTLR